MAEKFRYTLKKPARLLFSSVTSKSAPRDTPNATPKFSGVFGIEKEDLEAIIPLMVKAVQSETGNWTKPGDYYLACQSGETAAKRAIATGEFKAQGKTPDEALKIMEKANARAELYRKYAGILSASSQFDVELAKLEGGKVVDIPSEEHARAQAGKDLFYAGAWVVPAVAFQGYKQKSLDAKPGCTAFLQNVLYIRKDEKLGGSGPSNNEVFGSYAGYSDYDPTGMAPDGTASGAAGVGDLDDDIPF